MSHQSTSGPEADGIVCVVFSKDRPLQLDSTLRSLLAHAKLPNRCDVTVLWTASTWTLRALYEQVANENGRAGFVEETDFQSQLQELVSGSKFVAFIVDDTIFVSDFDLDACVTLLETDESVLAFSLRLGRNTTRCYTLRRPQGVPSMAALGGDVAAYRWVGSDGDFAYPLELSSSVYRTSDVGPLLRRLRYRNPNTLEAALAKRSISLSTRRPRVACYGTSVAFSNPVNVVQTDFPNRAAERYPAPVDDLAKAYREGYRLDVAAYTGFVSDAAHKEAELVLVRTAERIPLVSAVVPCYAQAEYLPDAVGSVLSQSMTDWELIVVDDGSPDETAKVVEDLIRAHPERRIRLLRKPNGGLASARNAGIQAAAGIFVLPLDADDLIGPTMLAEAVALLEQDRAIGFVYTDAVHFSDQDERVVPAEEYRFDRLATVNQPNYCALFPRSVWQAVGGYNPNMRWGYEDWDFWLSCGEHHYHGRRLPEALFRYRVREGSMFSQALAHDAELRARLRLNHPGVYRWRGSLVRGIHRIRRLPWWAAYRVRLLTAWRARRTRR